MPFNDLSNHELIIKSAATLEALPPDKWAYLMSLFSPRERYAENHERLEASFAASLKGDPEKQKECDAIRKAVEQEMTILFGVAKLLAVKDPTILESLGSAHTSTPSAQLHLIAPKDFDLSYDRKTGHLIASATKVATAKGYQIWGCDGDPKVEANWRLLTASHRCRGIEVPGVDRSKTNYLKMRAVRGANEFGPWSKLSQLDP
ncbi:hypothetical protein [Geomonas edaphica]|jgi:hypothetical protein|uniref:hypothetical protein n=1 Tax=Geomonas edaphica TaxID=2570226 RepID=UPI0010A85883|nr:hypothetical protein [Geomonas edaphica]